MSSFFPVDAALPEIVAAWQNFGSAVISAAPGAGKTTRIPPALLPHSQDVIYLIEPRRLAAVAAASRMAQLSGEQCGESFGYQVRGDSQYTRSTRIIALTPGVLLKKLQHNPELPGVGTIIFDEFHERSCEVDLALAFALETRDVWNPELKILIMSATLDTASPAALLGGAPVIQVPGREFPVQQLWSEKSCDIFNPAPEVARAVFNCYRNYPGDMLVFLPGAGEIAAVQKLLDNALDEAALILPLHGALNLAEQQQPLNPTPANRRKVVLATNVAESSLTIDGITLVIDSGLERRPVYNPASGLTTLETVKISRASAQQRTGRAGRTAPGIALRLWSSADERGLRPFAPPEILDCDLSRLVLELALWGTPAEQLKWLDPPPASRLRAGAQLLRQLGVLDEASHLTALGKSLAELPVHPRIGTLLRRAQKIDLLPLAIEIASLLEETPRFQTQNSVDLRLLVENFRRQPRQFRRSQLIQHQLQQLMHCHAAGSTTSECGLLLSFAYPERVAQNRARHSGSFLCANGKAAVLPAGDDLCRAEFLAIGPAGGRHDQPDARIQLAAPLSRTEVEARFHSEITESKEVQYDSERNQAQGFKLRKLGAIVLQRAPGDVVPEQLTQAVIAAALKQNHHLPPAKANGAQKLLQRLRFAATQEPDQFGDWTLDNWPEQLQQVIAPLLGEIHSWTELDRAPWLEILQNALSYSQLQELNQRYPEAFRSPAGASHAIDYAAPDQVPVLKVKLQEMLGVTSHPTVGSHHLPLRVELLSPANRPIQITSNLPEFWHGTYALVRKEMKARYPKHFWPENPAEAAPVLRTTLRRNK